MKGASFILPVAQPSVEEEARASLEEPQPKQSKEPRPVTVGDLLRLPPGKRSLAELAKRVELRVVEQRKPEPEEAKPFVRRRFGAEKEPGEEPKVEALRSVIQKPAAPLGFQHSKNPTGIPASLENAMIAVGMLGAECRYDVFHDRIIVKGHECGVKGDAHENLENVTLKVRQSVLERFGFDPSAGFTLDALRLRCLDHIFDPVRDYLDELRWDGVKRLDGELCGKLGDDGMR